MKKDVVKKMVYAFSAMLLVVLALSGCSGKNNGESTATNITTFPLPEVTEIDAFMSSVEELETSYNSNKLPSDRVQDAFAQAMVIEGYINEQPNLYGDSNYKMKVLRANTILQGIDINKPGLEKDNIDENFKSLVAVVDRLSKKFN